MYAVIFRDAADGECSTRQKRFVTNVKLSGSQKRKQKKKAAADGSKKDAANKQDSVIPKEHISAERTTYYEEEKKKMTLDEYEKVRGAKKKSLQTTTSAQRNVGAEGFQGLQALDKKMAEAEAATNEEKSKPRDKAVPSVGDEGASKKSENKPNSKMVIQPVPFLITFISSLQFPC